MLNVSVFYLKKIGIVCYKESGSSAKAAMARNRGSAGLRGCHDLRIRMVDTAPLDLFTLNSKNLIPKQQSEDE